MKKGFTLIELMISLAIFGILCAVIIPVIVSKHSDSAYHLRYNPSINSQVVSDRPDLTKCQLEGLDSLDLPVFKCQDNKFYTAF